MWFLILSCSHFPAAVNANEISALVTSGRRPDIKAVRPDTPKEVTDMIEKCWQEEPNSRPTSLGNYFKILIKKLFVVYIYILYTYISIK